MKNKKRKGNKFEQNKSSSLGITLIALVVTIIVLLILASVTISLLLGENGIINRTKESRFKTRMSQIAEEWDLYLASTLVENIETEKLDIKNIYAGELLKLINKDEELEIEENKIKDIKTLIKGIKTKEEQYIIIHEGELYYVSQNTIENNKNQVKWCEDIGIKIWDYVSNTGINIVNGDYELVNGIYVCTPKINTGFVKETTRYVKEENKVLTPTNWINKKPDEDWYDYKNKKWANLYVESNGIESYYVWIPRYVYKKDTINSVEGNERMDVKFVDINNTYIDAQTGEKTTWEELQAQNYQIPEAFA